VTAIRVRTRALAPLAALAVIAVGLAGCGTNGSTAAPAGSPAASPSTPSTQAAAKAVPTCPLTGEKPRKGQKIKRIPLAVKIDNVAPALPQAGVNSADVVFEELVEGGLTRLMAVFGCSSVATVGPIRSARTSDADILALLHGSVFGFSGANPEALPQIDAHGHTVQISQDVEGNDFHRDLSRPAPHNVFASTDVLIKAGLEKQKHLKNVAHPLFTYGPLPTWAKAAHSFSLAWPDTTASWSWSGGHWLRTQDGAVDRDTGGNQLSAANDVVMKVTIGSTGLHDVLGNASPLDITTGSNPVWIFRNGKVIKGTWHRKNVTSPLTFVGKGGKRLTLTPGRTWVELLPTTEHSPNIG
jgi:hypothetical protein